MVASLFWSLQLVVRSARNVGSSPTCRIGVRIKVITWTNLGSRPRRTGGNVSSNLTDIKRVLYFFVIHHLFVIFKLLMKKRRLTLSSILEADNVKNWMEKNPDFFRRYKEKNSLQRDKYDKIGNSAEPDLRKRNDAQNDIIKKNFSSERLPNTVRISRDDMLDGEYAEESRNFVTEFNMFITAMQKELRGLETSDYADNSEYSDRQVDAMVKSNRRKFEEEGGMEKIVSSIKNKFQEVKDAAEKDPQIKKNFQFFQRKLQSIITQLKRKSNIRKVKDDAYGFNQSGVSRRTQRELDTRDEMYRREDEEKDRREYLRLKAKYEK